jgi:hypothetical protein
MTLEMVRVPVWRLDNWLLREAKTEFEPTGLTGRTLPEMTSWEKFDIIQANYHRIEPPTVSDDTDQLAELTPLDRIRAKQPEMIQRALAYRLRYGDPVLRLGQLFQDILPDHTTWDEIIDEPYG